MGVGGWLVSWYLFDWLVGYLVGFNICLIGRLGNWLVKYLVDHFFDCFSLLLIDSLIQ